MLYSFVQPVWKVSLGFAILWEQGMWEQRLEAVENKLSEVQSTENKLSDLVKNIESQLGGYHKEIHNEISTAISSKPLPTNVSASSTPLQVPEDSVAQIAAFLATEQKEKEKRQMNIVVHNLEESKRYRGSCKKAGWH